MNFVFILWFFNSRSGRLLTVFLIFLFSLRSYAGSGQITDFDLKTCGSKNCLRIHSKKAYLGFLPASYAFDFAKVEIVEKGSGKITPFTSSDAFYDGKGKKLYLRNLEKKNNVEAVYDLESEKLSFYFLGPGQ